MQPVRECDALSSAMRHKVWLKTTTFLFRPGFFFFFRYLLQLSWKQCTPPKNRKSLGDRQKTVSPVFELFCCFSTGREKLGSTVCTTEVSKLFLRQKMAFWQKSAMILSSSSPVILIATNNAFSVFVWNRSAFVAFIFLRPHVNLSFFFLMRNHWRVASLPSLRRTWKLVHTRYSASNETVCLTYIPKMSVHMFEILQLVKLNGSISTTLLWFFARFSIIPDEGQARSQNCFPPYVVKFAVLIMFPPFESVLHTENVGQFPKKERGAAPTLWNRFKRQQQTHNAIIINRQQWFGNLSLSLDMLPVGPTCFAYVISEAFLQSMQLRKRHFNYSCNYPKLCGV